MESGKRESLRRALAVVAMMGGWAAALGIFAYATLEFDPNHGDFAPQWVGFTFILCIGIAIAGSSARARMRLSDTIVQAFKAGLKAADERSQQHTREAVEQFHQQEEEG
jgi:hypothetical protein